VTRHVELGDDANATVTGVLDDVPHLNLRVEETVRTFFVEQGEGLALDAESLVFGEVPVEDVHLHRLHTIEVLPDDIERHEVPARIDHQTSPGEARLVIDGHRCDRVASGVMWIS
jgi:hypothetical protein